MKQKNNARTGKNKKSPKKYDENWETFFNGLYSSLLDIKIYFLDLTDQNLS